jgi:16S rRNA processing protein RimM
MELIKIGKALKTHGFKGHLKVFIDAFYMDDFMEMKALFIDNLPYFITYKDINSDSQAIIALEDINSKESAFLLQGKDIYAKEEDLAEILEEDPYQELIGYTMEDKQLGKIGEIVAILEMPQQFLAQILKEGKEVLVPLNDVFIQKIDTNKKLVYTKLPEGLLDIF